MVLLYGSLVSSEQPTLHETGYAVYAPAGRVVASSYAELRAWFRDDDVQGYLDEFAFRFNRRRSEFRSLLFRRLLEPAVQVDPVTYLSLVVNPSPKRTKPRLPAKRRAAPPFARHHVIASTMARAPPAPPHLDGYPP